MVDVAVSLGRPDFFMLLVGCISGAIASCQPEGKRFSADALGLFGVCFASTLYEWKSESQQRVAKVIAKLVAKDSQANSLSLQPVQVAQLLDFLQNLCTAWARMPANLVPPLPHWVLAEIAFFNGPAHSALSKRHYLNGMMAASSDLAHVDGLDLFWSSSMLLHLIECSLCLKEYLHAAFFMQMMTPQIDYAMAYRALRNVPWEQEIARIGSHDQVTSASTSANPMAAVQNLMQAIPLACFWDIHLIEFVVYFLKSHGRADVAQQLVMQFVRRHEMAAAAPQSLPGKASRNAFIQAVQQKHLKRIVMELGTSTPTST
ncbi:hypothetical protein BC831DRAFT_90082 [Entophlyctis helioformis]|nr:hypothetical protein BC831DRAFT_90082 [Entophlyctis helioformis]